MALNFCSLSLSLSSASLRSVMSCFVPITRRGLPSSSKNIFPWSWRKRTDPSGRMMRYSIENSSFPRPEKASSTTPSTMRLSRGWTKVRKVASLPSNSSGERPKILKISSEMSAFLLTMSHSQLPMWDILCASLSLAAALRSLSSMRLLCMAAPRLPAATFRASISAPDHTRSVLHSSKPMKPHHMFSTKTGTQAMDSMSWAVNISRSPAGKSLTWPITTSPAVMASTHLEKPCSLQEKPSRRGLPIWASIPLETHSCLWVVRSSPSAPLWFSKT